MCVEFISVVSGWRELWKKNRQMVLTTVYNKDSKILATL